MTTLRGPAPAPASTGSAQPGLQECLRRLDSLLLSLLRTAEARGGIAAAALRGLFVSPEEAADLLTRPAGAPAFTGLAGSRLTGPEGAAGRLGRLQTLFGLTPFDTDLLVIAVAPELDLRYERIYGFLQDDTARRRATLDLALNLRTASPAEKAARLAGIADSALIRHGLVHLVPDPGQAAPPLLAHALTVDGQVTGFLLGAAALDRRLAGWCRLEAPQHGLGSLDLPDSTRRALQRLATSEGPAAVFHLHGPPGSGRAAVAAALAAELGKALLVARPGPVPEHAAHLDLVVREALLRDAVLYVEDAETGTLGARLAAVGGPVTLLGGRHARGMEGIVDVALVLPDAAAREKLWVAALATHDLALEAADLGDLADRFRLGQRAIARAAGDAAGRMRWEAAAGTATASTIRAQCFAAARARSGHALGTLAPRVATLAGWRDLILPDAEEVLLRAFCEQARWRSFVLGAWGFGRVPAGTAGLNGLFAGPPGTGKTMAAGVLAAELGLDLYRIDLVQVVSKYIGETQQNLDRIFRAAADSNAVLLFDEAEALFGARSEVRDAHDRYANIEVAYLLQKMEDHEGITILATNLRQNLDVAFARRLHCVVEFPFPDAAQRRRIWAVTFPPEAPLDPGIAWDVLARDVRLAGGNIRNIAMAAAVSAAAGGVPIAMPHLLAAARREYLKLGRAWTGPAPEGAA